MTGEELRELREQSRVSSAQLAHVLDVGEDAIHAIENKHVVTKQEAYVHRLGIWEANRDALLAVSGLPTCEWMESGSHSLEEIGRHGEACDKCAPRMEHVERHMAPVPRPPGIVAGIAHFGSGLAGWKQSAFAGGSMLVMMAGIGAPIILLTGLVRRDWLFALGSFAFLLLLYLAGAVGGVVHYLTRGMRSRGWLGYYGSWVLVLYGYLLAVGVMLHAGEIAAGVETHEFDPADPATWIIFGLVGLIFGLILGRGAHQKRRS
jgi:hypothetical protein